MYAGNVGFSQSLELLIDAAEVMPQVTFVVNGEGSARSALEEKARHLSNVRFSNYQPTEKVPEVLASADVHIVALRAGLGAVSVPSKTYSILAAGRPILASIDVDTEVPRILKASGAGVVVSPDNSKAFVAALDEMLQNTEKLAEMGRSGRKWVETHVSPAAVAKSYSDLISSLG